MAGRRAGWWAGFFLAVWALVPPGASLQLPRLDDTVQCDAGLCPQNGVIGGPINGDCGGTLSESCVLDRDYDSPCLPLMCHSPFVRTCQTTVHSACWIGLLRLPLGSDNRDAFVTEMLPPLVEHTFTITQHPMFEFDYRLCVYYPILGGLAGPLQQIPPPAAGTQETVSWTANVNGAWKVAVVSGAPCPSASSDDAGVDPARAAPDPLAAVLRAVEDWIPGTAAAECPYCEVLCASRWSYAIGYE